MAGELITAPWQVEWNGLLLGAGTVYRMYELHGWDELPGVDVLNVPRSARSGAHAGRRYSGQRIVTFIGAIVDPPDGAEQALAALEAATGLVEDPDEAPLVIRTQDRTLLAHAGVRARLVPANIDRQDGYAGTITIQWVCSDWRRYSLTEQSVTIPAPTAATGGLAYPLVYSTGGVDEPANQLTGDDSEFEATAGSWVANQNCAVAQTTAQANQGTGSLELTASSAANMSARHVGGAGSNGFPVVPGRDYLVRGWFRAAATTRTVQVGVNWYDAAAGFLSTSLSSGVADSTSGWTRAAHPLLAPASAAFAVVIAQVVSPGAAEVHYLDTVMFAEPDGIPGGLEYGSEGLPGSTVVTNGGNAPTNPVVTVHGPCDTPTVIDRTRGRRIEFATVLGAGEVLVVDTDAGTVLLNGTSNRLYTVTAGSVPVELFDLPPGQTELDFRAVDFPAPGAQAVVTFRDAHA